MTGSMGLRLHQRRLHHVVCNQWVLFAGCAFWWWCCLTFLGWTGCWDLVIVVRELLIFVLLFLQAFGLIWHCLDSQWICFMPRQACSSMFDWVNCAGGKWIACCWIGIRDKEPLPQWCCCFNWSLLDSLVVRDYRGIEPVWWSLYSLGWVKARHRCLIGVIEVRRVSIFPI